MKKTISVVFLAILSISIFAASFKKGQKVYVSKDSPIAKSEKAPAEGTARKGDFGTVVESNSKMTNVKFSESGISAWIKTSDLTKKKVAKSTTSTKLDNIALSGKGSISASALNQDLLKNNNISSTEEKVENNGSQN